MRLKYVFVENNEREGFIEYYDIKIPTLEEEEGTVEEEEIIRERVVYSEGEVETKDIKRDESLTRKCVQIWCSAAR